MLEKLFKSMNTTLTSLPHNFEIYQRMTPEEHTINSSRKRNLNYTKKSALMF